MSEQFCYSNVCCIFKNKQTGSASDEWHCQYIRREYAPLLSYKGYDEQVARKDSEGSEAKLLWY